MEIKRYDIFYSPDNKREQGFKEDPEGEFVRFEDVREMLEDSKVLKKLYQDHQNQLNPLYSDRSGKT